MQFPRLGAVSAAPLPRRVCDAIIWAFPGEHVVSRVRRFVVGKLARVDKGPAGPYSMFWEKLKLELNRQYPYALTELFNFYGNIPIKDVIDRTYSNITPTPDGGNGDGARLPVVVRTRWCPWPHNDHVYELDMDALLGTAAGNDAGPMCPPYVHVASALSSPCWPSSPPPPSPPEHAGDSSITPPEMVSLSASSSAHALLPLAPQSPPTPPSEQSGLQIPIPVPVCMPGGVAADGGSTSGDCQSVIICDPCAPEVAAMQQHCAAVQRMGLAVQAVKGQPALVAVFAPASVAPVQGIPVRRWEPFAATVYVLDCTAAAAQNGGGASGEAAVAELLACVREALQAVFVAKLVNGCEQIQCLEAACQVTAAGQVLDLQVPLDGLSAMLGLPPASQLPPQLLGTTAGRIAETEPAPLAVLQRQATALRDALSATGLWRDRPDRLTTLARRHFAALKAALWAASGQDGAWLRRPLSAAEVGAAAAAASELPGLWDGLVGEALPWVVVRGGHRRLHRLHLE